MNVTVETTPTFLLRLTEEEAHQLANILHLFAVRNYEATEDQMKQAREIRDALDDAIAIDDAIDMNG